MKKAIALLLVLVMALSLAACGKKEEPGNNTENPTVSDKPIYLTIGTASVGGAFYPIGTSIATLINNTVPNAKAVAQATAGSPQNIEFLRSGDIQIAMCRAVEGHDAYNNTGLYAGIGEGIDKIRCITPLYEGSPNHLFVRIDAGIDSVEDLVGKKVAVGPIASGGDKDMAVTMQSYGLSFDDIIPDYSDAAQAVDLMKDGLIDACMLGMSTGAASYIELMQTGKVKLLSMTEEAIAKYHEIDPMFTRSVIAANTYPNQPEDIVSVHGLPMTISCTADLDDETVYLVCKALYENVEEFHKAHALVADWDPSMAGTDVFFPYHDGAAKFWKEVGIQK